MHHVDPAWPPHIYSKDELHQMLGRPPRHEEWENANCSQMGRPGHLSCGICPFHEQPRTACGCLWPFGRAHQGPAMRVRVQGRGVIVDLERIDNLPPLEEISNLAAQVLNTPATPQLASQVEMDLRNIFLKYMQNRSLRRMPSTQHLEYFA